MTTVNKYRVEIMWCDTLIHINRSGDDLLVFYSNRSTYVTKIGDTDNRICERVIFSYWYHLIIYYLLKQYIVH